MKLLLTTVLFAVYANLPGQLNNHSYANFTFVDVLNYTLHSKQNMANSLQKAIDEGKIKIYSDSLLKTAISYQDYYELITVKTLIQVPNPMNPDDIYDLIDTFVYETLYPSDLVLLDNGSVEWVNDIGFKIYISYKGFKKILDARLVSLLEYFKLNSLNEINEKSLVPFCRQQVKEQGKKVFEHGINKKVTGYWDNSFTKTFTPEEIQERGTIYENKQHQNPYNPDDPYDLIDTVVATDFDPETINVLRAYFQWKNNGVKTEAEFVGFAPLYRPMMAGILLPPTSIFVIKSTDYFKHIHKTEKQFWLHFYSYLLQNRSFYEDFNIYNESDFAE